MRLLYCKIQFRSVFKYWLSSKVQQECNEVCRFYTRPEKDQGRLVVAYLHHANQPPITTSAKRYQTNLRHSIFAKKVAEVAGNLRKTKTCQCDIIWLLRGQRANRSTSFWKVTFKYCCVAKFKLVRALSIGTVSFWLLPISLRIPDGYFKALACPYFCFPQWTDT